MYDKLDITSSIPSGSDYVDNHYELKYMTKKPPKDLIHRFFFYLLFFYFSLHNHALFVQRGLICETVPSALPRK